MQDMTDRKRSNGGSKDLAAVKLPLSEKWVLKSHFLGTVPSGSALFSQRLRRRGEVCKTLCVNSILSLASMCGWTLNILPFRQLLYKG
jgi:hypothetical protein